MKKWSDIRANWEDRALNLYGPGTDSGTFDYFTEAINGKSQACRADFTASEDDNVLVQGIAGDPNALGFFGYAYYGENRSRLKAVPIDAGKGRSHLQNRPSTMEATNPFRGRFLSMSARKPPSVRRSQRSSNSIWRMHQAGDRGRICTLAGSRLSTGARKIRETNHRLAVCLGTHGWHES